MRVVVCGAGIAGLTLANTLDAEVVVLERSPAPRTQGYMIDFFGTGYDAVEAMGLLPAVEDVAYHVREALLLDEQGRKRGSIVYTQIEQAVHGRLLSIMRPDLERALRGDVDVRFGTTLTGVDQDADGVRVTLSTGEVIEADLLVGADGIHSAVRELVFGGGFLRYLGFHTAAFQFDAPEIHERVRDTFCLTDTVGRQMGFYALRNGRVAAFAVHRTPDPTLPADIPAAVRDTYGDLGWVVPQALAQLPPAEDIYYDQVAQIQMPTWSKGRVVLVGDSCYAVSLLAGQGASLGIAGAYLLAHELAKRPVPEALAEYERQWRPVAAEKQRVGRSGARWFLPASPLQLRIRRAALRAGRLPVVNKYVAGVLVGKSTGLIANLG